jgi:peptidoglycan/LPS O-acetylase OafA/YrhL
MHRNLSVYLDLVRFLAALLVFAVHANYQRFTGGLPGGSHFYDLGNDAVMVFFVLSGFVIAHVAAHKESTLPEYAASRFARLYSVAVPAIIVTMLADAAGSVLDPSLYTGRWYEYDEPWARLAASLSFTNELWFSYTRPFSNGPFWSLGYEAWYYVLFGAAYFLRGPVRFWCVAGICLLVGPKILLLLPVWWLGVWACRRAAASALPLGKSAALFFGPLLVYLGFRWLDGPDRLLEMSLDWLGEDVLYDQLSWSRYFLSSYVIGACVAAHFVGAAGLARRLPACAVLIERPVRYAAGFTFALYLLHYPLLQFFAAFTAAAGLEPWRAVVVVAGPLAVVWMVGRSIERQKGPLKALFLGWMSPAPRPAWELR